MHFRKYSFCEIVYVTLCYCVLIGRSFEISRRKSNVSAALASSLTGRCPSSWEEPSTVTATGRGGISRPAMMVTMPITRHLHARRRHKRTKSRPKGNVHKLRHTRTGEEIQAGVTSGVYPLQ